MVQPGLTTGTDYLLDAAKAHFDAIFHQPAMKINEPLDGLNWSPAISFKPNAYSLVIAETSETVFPAMFNLRRAKLEKYTVPVSVYSVCAEEEFLKSQDAVKELVEAGYGLVTVDVSGASHVRQECVPIQQIIYREIFNEEIKSLPRSIRQRLAESFQRYSHIPPSGVTDITEVMEGVIVKAGAAAKKKSWLTNAEVKVDVAALLKNMQAKPQFGGALGAIGSAQGFMSEWRNANHHFPKNAAAAAKRYRDCRHGFLEGLRQIKNFKEAMSNIGLSFRL